MIVDDDERLARVVARLLGSCGYDTVPFSHPHDAIAALRSEPTGFDAVITDLSMPELSLEELIAGLRAIRPDLVVIVSTGKPWAIDDAARARLGISEVLSKPWRLEDALHALERLRLPHTLP